MTPVVLAHERRISLQDVVSVAYGNPATADEASLRLLDERREQAVRWVESRKQPAYGFNRGFGHNVDVEVASRHLTQLQHNLIRSHASSVGPNAPRPIVRATMFLRAVSLMRGHSAVRSDVVRILIDCLNAGITPVIPTIGSVGASGDLAPLSHLALTLIGEGQTLTPDSEIPRPASEALASAELRPLSLEMKEGLALNNGLQFTTAYGILTHAACENLLKHAFISSALSTLVLLGSDVPFRDDLMQLRPHRGSLRTARAISALMKDAPLRESHRHHHSDGEVQDPYSLRCAAQAIGAAADLMDDAARTFEIEANSATDNPLLLRDPATGEFTDIVSGGHFHGMPIATRVYGLIQAMAILAHLSNLRCARFVDQHRNRGLGSDVLDPKLTEEQRSASSGMMIPEYVSASLVNTIWSAAMPTHLFSIPTDAGQEDHVSMSASLAVRAWETARRTAEALAIELAYNAQAAYARREITAIPCKHELSAQGRAELKRAQNNLVEQANRIVGDEFEVQARISLRYRLSPAERILSPICERIIARIADVFPPVTTDRSMSAQLMALTDLVEAGDLASIAADGGAFDG